MNVLVACEESQEVCKAFRAKGHNAFSCDIQDCSGGHPEWHIKGNVINILEPFEYEPEYMIRFKTQDGTYHEWKERFYRDACWDLIIAHPPCTYLTVTGNSWFNEERYGEKAIRRKQERHEAIDFFMKFVNADCERIVIENPIGVMSTVYRKPDQIIQPYQFGHPARKATCLWLKGLNLLRPTNIIEPDLKRYVCKSGKILTQSADYGWASAKDRSRTYSGIAKAMAEQWG